MDEHTRADRRRVAAFAAASLAVFALVAAVRLAPPSYAARIYVRWDTSVSPAERAALEARFRLREPELREGSTWAYDLVDRSAGLIREMVAHPAVADTHYIDQGGAAVLPDAPEGTTLVGPRWLARLRTQAAVSWAGLFSGSALVVSTVWLVTTRGRRPREHA